MRATPTRARRPSPRRSSRATGRSGATTALATLALAACGAAPAARAQPQLAWPLEEPVEERGLVSSFGENRGNHFHGGVDMTTRGRVGVPVVAVRDGEVYRIKVKWRGLGRAIYVRHPDGLVTVAGHLAGFAEPMRSWVDEQLRAKGPYPGDLWPPTPFPVRAGEVVAWTGKTGGGPPHLHFETRRGNGSVPVDPFAEGLPCPDDEPPRVEALWAAPPPDSGRPDPEPVVLPSAEPVVIETPARPALRLRDPMGSGTGAPHELRVTLDGAELARLKVARFAYSDTHLSRFVHVRQSAATGDDGAWVWAVDLPGNDLPRELFRGVPEIAAVDAERDAVLDVFVADGCGNETRRSVPVRLVPAAPAKARGTLVGTGGGRVEGRSLRLEVPKDALGEPARLRVEAPDESVGAPPDGLRLVQGPAAVEPAWMPLARKAVVSFGVSKPATRHGVYRWDRGAEAWFFWGDDRRSSGRLGTTTDRLGPYALLADESPPAVHSVERVAARGRPWTDDADEVRVRYRELGEGVPWDGARLTLSEPPQLDGRELVADNDPDLGELVFRLPAEAEGTRVAGALRIADRAGNEARRELALDPPGP